ncbi:hypothetical protein C1J03_07275 [Sulfitobacter sp. SK012]|uniref:MBL fold metallo-hydrolase n=1 Tax=Sulfitobacter sp. SK012 TaxID=1389005 RepID=UPI000E0A9D62|nr:MBL fold metallo-hydrolase [Sulfitobacter sp. SK012]AXI45851.1 hypothetical protein C1J03_07275 [Sulfitobacter sp. SK012]
MTEIHALHRFFPVGQGLFAAGSLAFSQSRPTGWRNAGARRIKGRSGQTEIVKNVYRWVYDCGSSTAKRLVTNAIADLKGDCEGEKIDLLTLSHFHNDHINGAVDLLNAIGAKTVMLPWAPLWHRLLIGFEQGIRAEDPEMLFFVDPVQYFEQEAGDGFDQVLFVMPSDGEGPPFPTEPTEAPEPPEGLDDPEKPSDQGDPVSYGDLEGAYGHLDRRVRMLRSGIAISVYDVWEFLPYNDPATKPNDPFGFAAKVESYRGSLLNGDEDEREAALKDLKALYKATFGRTAMNDVSLMLYGGAVGNWRGHFYCECLSHSLSEGCWCWQQHETTAAILLTGDGNLGSVSKWDTLERYLGRRRAIHASVFQVPHHGARANWYDGLAAAASPRMSIFCSDPNHSYGHPHAEVLRDFWKHLAVQVDQHSEFSMRFVLER